MKQFRGPIYEISVVAAATELASVRDFLERFKLEHSGDVGLVDQRIFEGTDQSSLTLQLAFENNEILDEFLSGRASVLESGIESAAPGEVTRHARVLHEQDTSNLPSDAVCRNCGTALRGQYCGQCGQRSRSRLISLWELVRDAFGDLFELDSRLWQTLFPLLFRPGRLTADYLQGKRARFMPPFRMYLVLSLLFFVVAFFDPGKDLALFYTETNQTSETTDQTEVVSDQDSPQTDTSNSESNKFNISISADDGEEEDSNDCEIDDEAIRSMPVWLQQRLTPNRLQHICEQVTADDGEQLKEKMLDNIPAALIVLLPLMALVLKFLYPLSRRYYVEHVLFFVHFHAFFFLLLSLQILWARLIATLGFGEAIGILPIVLSAFYIPIYLFKAMRRVYAQGFWLTFLKYVVLVASYIVGFSVMLLGALAIAAFSI